MGEWMLQCLAEIVIQLNIFRQLSNQKNFNVFSICFDVVEQYKVVSDFKMERKGLLKFIFALLL